MLPGWSIGDSNPGPLACQRRGSPCASYSRVLFCVPQSTRFPHRAPACARLPPVWWSNWWSRQGLRHVAPPSSVPAATPDWRALSVPVGSGVAGPRLGIDRRQCWLQLRGAAEQRVPLAGRGCGNRADYPVAHLCQLECELESGMVNIRGTAAVLQQTSLQWVVAAWGG